ncbi:hypothetical protein VPH35_036983 [Triticum aestivum]|uniref:TF-B3 domain-containing protein n=1 Tax=Aegilops tauschii TaxID=37682 RepID=M8CHT6_AEGTA
MTTAQKFNCLVTNDANRTYFGCPGWKALADAYEMEAGERATFYLDYDRDEIMVYYKPAGSDDGALTPDYDPDSARLDLVIVLKLDYALILAEIAAAKLLFQI